MKSIKLFILLFCILNTRHFNAQVYKQASTTDKVAGGQAYILPKASFLIEIHVESTTLTKGTSFMNNFNASELIILKEKYGVDPKKYASAKAQVETKTFEIVEDSLKITLKARPDFNKIFYVDPESKWYRNQIVTFNYSSDGILTEGESNNENKSFDIIVKGISGLTSVVGAFYKNAKNYPGTLAPIATDIETLDVALAKFSTLENQLNYDIYKDLKKKLEKNYSDIFSALFYKEKKKVTKFKFIYTPSSSETLSSDIAFFKLNALGEIEFNRNLTDIIAKKVTKVDATGDNKFYTFNLDALADQQKAYYEARDVSKTGFAFNIPLSVNFKLTNPDKELLYFEACKIPQLGIVGYTNTRKEKLIFSLDVMGELKKLTIEGKAITGDQVASVSSGLGEIIKTAKGESDATQLENEVKKLENIKKKRDLLLELESEE